MVENQLIFWSYGRLFAWKCRLLSHFVWKQSRTWHEFQTLNLSTPKSCASHSLELECRSPCLSSRSVPILLLLSIILHCHEWRTAVLERYRSCSILSICILPRRLSWKTRWSLTTSIQGLYRTASTFGPSLNLLLSLTWPHLQHSSPTI